MAVGRGSLEVPEGCWAKVEPAIENLHGEVNCDKTLAMVFRLSQLPGDECSVSNAKPRVAALVQLENGHGYRLCGGEGRLSGTLIAVQEDGGFMFRVEAAKLSDLAKAFRIMASYREGR
jgi:hypothetical protein